MVSLENVCAIELHYITDFISTTYKKNWGFFNGGGLNFTKYILSMHILSMYIKPTILNSKEISK